ncbi:MAG: glycosyltransferase family 39 protein [Chloroflexota bacterium]
MIRTRWLADLAIMAALLVLSLVVFIRAADTVRFHGDESEWINSGKYFRYLFLDGTTSGEVWRPAFITRDQPPMGRYVIGLVVWSTGRDPAAVNRSYAWNKDLAANEQEGRVPGPDLLIPVRHAMAALGALSVVGLYVAGRVLEGPLTGSVAALLVTFSPLVQQNFSQARTESLLALFTVIALALVLITARRFAATGVIPRAGWLIGPLLGLALATKLTAGLAILGTTVYGIVSCLNRSLADATEGGRKALWTVAVGIFAAGVFIASNPFLWPDPVSRTTSMLDQQKEIMVEQGTQFGGAVKLQPAERLWLVIQRTFARNATHAFDAGLPSGSPPVLQSTFLDLPTPGGISLELILALLGFGALTWRGIQDWSNGSRHGAANALLWWIVAYFGGISGNLSLDWPRYYVPTAFLGSLLVGLAVATLTRWIFALINPNWGYESRLAEHEMGAAR